MVKSFTAKALDFETFQQMLPPPKFPYATAELDLAYRFQLSLRRNGSDYRKWVLKRAINISFPSVKLESPKFEWYEQIILRQSGLDNLWQTPIPWPIYFKADPITFMFSRREYFIQIRSQVSPSYLESVLNETLSKFKNQTRHLPELLIQRQVEYQATLDRFRLQINSLHARIQKLIERIPYLHKLPRFKCQNKRILKGEKLPQKAFIPIYKNHTFSAIFHKADMLLTISTTPYIFKKGFLGFKVTIEPFISMNPFGYEIPQIRESLTPKFYLFSMAQEQWVPLTSVIPDDPELFIALNKIIAFGDQPKDYLQPYFTLCYWCNAPLHAFEIPFQIEATTIHIPRLCCSCFESTVKGKIDTDELVGKIIEVMGQATLQEQTVPQSDAIVRISTFS
jgi:hypothetical protein